MATDLQLLLRLLLPPLMCVCEHKAREGVGGQKPETEPQRLGFGPVMPNSGGGRCWVLVGLLVQSNEGRGAAHSQMRAGERG